MAPTIKGQDVEVTILKNGQPVAILNAISFEITDASELQKKDYLGEKRPREERIEKGWTGRVTYEIEDNELDTLHDAEVALSNNNQDNAVFGIQTAEKFPDGGESRYSYSPATFKLGSSVSSRTEKLTKTFEFSASDRKRIA